MGTVGGGKHQYSLSLLIQLSCIDLSWELINWKGSEQVQYISRNNSIIVIELLGGAEVLFQEQVYRAT